MHDTDLSVIDENSVSTAPTLTEHVPPVRPSIDNDRNNFIDIPRDRRSIDVPRERNSIDDPRNRHIIDVPQDRHSIDILRASDDTVRLSCGHVYTRSFLMAALDDASLDVHGEQSEHFCANTSVRVPVAGEAVRPPDQSPSTAWTSFGVGVAIAIPPVVALVIMGAITVALAVV
jgi:hypothetical protein